MRPFLGTDNPEPKKPHYHFCKVSVHVYFCDNGKYTSYFQNHLKTNYGGKKKKTKHVLLPAQKQLGWCEKVPATGNVFY